MGYSCRPDNVMLCLSALGSVLSDMGLPVHVGDAEAAAHGAYAQMHVKDAQRKKTRRLESRDRHTHARPLRGAARDARPRPKDAPPRSMPRRVAAGFLACAAPDLDFVIGFVGPVEYLLSHRGVTHSLILLPLWALLFSWILAKILREPARLARALRRHRARAARRTSSAI